MTREERLELLKQIEKDIYVCSIESTFLDDAKSCAIHSVIEELEREPCEDAISRQSVLDTTVKKNSIWNSITNSKGENLEEIISQLPPVNPQQKTGCWIKSRDCYGNNHFTCPFCEHDIATKADTLGDNYCSNCGAKLQESEG